MCKYIKQPDLKNKIENLRKLQKKNEEKNPTLSEFWDQHKIARKLSQQKKLTAERWISSQAENSSSYPAVKAGQGSKVNTARHQMELILH